MFFYFTVPAVVVFLQQPFPAVLLHDFVESVFAVEVFPFLQQALFLDFLSLSFPSFKTATFFTEKEANVLTGVTFIIPINANDKNIFFMIMNFNDMY